MLCYLHVDGETHPLVASAARDQLNRPVEEAGRGAAQSRSGVEDAINNVNGSDASRFRVNGTVVSGDNSMPPGTQSACTEPNNQI
jgi:hypothetical protein